MLVAVAHSAAMLQSMPALLLACRIILSIFPQALASKFGFGASAPYIWTAPREHTPDWDARVSDMSQKF